MRASLRQDSINFRDVVSVDEGSRLEPIWRFDKQVAAASGQGLDSFTIRTWHRPENLYGEGGRAFEFVGETSPLVAISDLSSLHSGLDFTFHISAA